MFKDKKFLIIVVSVVLIALVALFAVSNYQREDTSEDISTFQECVDAGYPVMESYPEQCLTPEGLLFVREIEEDETENGDGLVDEESDEFYGSSTNYPCEVDEDCFASGCNNEICQSTQEDEMMSACLFPEQPLPQDLEYSCGCFEGECRWGK